MTATARVLEHRAETDPRRGFEGPRDFLQSVYAARKARDRDSVTDHRLRAVSVREAGAAGGPLAFALPLAFTPKVIQAAAGSDEQGTYADPYGGFAVRAPGVTDFALGAVESDPTVGRTLVLPMDAPELGVVARVGTTHSTSVTAGLEVVRTPETTTRASTRMKLERVNLSASSLFGFSYATEELLDAGTAAFAAILAAAYRDEFGSKIFREKLTGTGAGEYLGALNSPAKIEVAKESGQAADTIQAANVVKMSARVWGYNRSIWLANHDTREQLAQAAYVVEGSIGGGIVPVFQPARSEFEPDMLWGRPCFFSEHMPALGDAGDLACINWSQYLEGVYQPLESAESVHVRWSEHERAFKFWLRNAGAPWWRAALTPDNGANTLSPIVTLAERA